jgi:tetratricopeptide (TPR) repeat protein
MSMRRGFSIGFVALGLVLSATALRGDDQPGQKERAEDVRKVAELQKRIDELSDAGKFAETLKLAEEWVAGVERLRGAKHWETLTARCGLSTLKHVASLSAEAQQQFRDAENDCMAGDRIFAQGKYAEAEPQLRRALAVYRRLLGEQHLATAKGLGNLGRTLMALSKYDEADALLRQALAIYRKLLAEQHPYTAGMLKSLAELAHRRGKYPEAERLGRQALAIFRETVGEENDQTLDCLNTLAVTLIIRGELRDAEKLLRQALAITRKVRGEEHRDTATILINLAAVLQHQGQFGSAETYFRQGLSLCRKVFGERHSSTLTCLNNLGLNLHSQGKYPEADSILRQALAVQRQASGPAHPRTAITLDNLALNLQAQGDLASADPLFRQALAIFRAALGDQHDATATCMNNLAKNLSGQGKHAEAERLNRQVLAIQRRALGDRHPDTLRSINNLAMDLNALRQYPEAARLLGEVWQAHRDKMGDRHPNTLVCLSNVAVNLNAQGEYAAAEPLFRQVLKTRREVLPKQHPDIALSLDNLAFTRKAQGEHAEAEALYREALAIRRNVLGESHAETAASLRSLGTVLHVRGADTDAEPLLREAVLSFEAARLRVAGKGSERVPFAARRSPSPLLAVLLARQGQAAEAWKWAETSLARGLLDDLTDQLLSSPSREEQERLRTRAARLEQLDRLLLPLLTREQLTAEEQKERTALLKERTTLQTELAREGAERSRREVFSLERVQKQLPADAALVLWIDRPDFAPAGDPKGDNWACVVRRFGAPAWSHLAGSGAKGAWTEDDRLLSLRLRDALAAGEPGWRALAQRLRQQRIDPLKPALAGDSDAPPVRRLIVVPVGAMAGVPVEALTDDYLISYAPSGTVYARLREGHRPFRGSSVLALGDPAFAPPTAAPDALPDSGVLLALVLSGGNAEKAGLHSGDVLLRYGDRELKSVADLKPAAKGEAVPVRVWRAGQSFDTRLAAGPLGVIVSREPAAEALRKRRPLDEALAGRTRGEIKPLPATRYEVKAVQALFPRATVLLGAEASEQKFDELAQRNQLQDYRVLHFATHGRIDPFAASRSALLLAAGSPLAEARPAQPTPRVYDGQLMVWEMDAWRLDADLVTLSACETALGPNGGGEGFAGFSQVMFRKGARSLLLSLWKVDDTATALLMTRFYENLLGQRKDLKEAMTRAEALREAKNWLRTLPRARRDALAAGLAGGELRGTIVPGKPIVEPSKEPSDTPYAHPRYWAAFVLLGDPE